MNENKAAFEKISTRAIKYKIQLLDVVMIAVKMQKKDFFVISECPFISSDD